MAEPAPFTGDRLDGRAALVTGAARGIGRAIAIALAHNGAEVIAVDRDRDAIAELADALPASAVAATTTLAADVTIESDVADLLSGCRSVDILVNNAGGGSVGGFVELTLEQWERELRASLTSTFLCTRAFLPAMIANRWGRVINIGSQLALRGGEKQCSYSAAKAGVHGLTRALAREVAGTGVTVNTIAPGPTLTPGFAKLPDAVIEQRRGDVPLGRFAEPEEIAASAVLLAGRAGAFYTGATLNVSGGDVID